MGLHGVSGHEFRVIAANTATPGPRPTPTESDGAKDAAAPARVGPDTREALVQTVRAQDTSEKVDVKRGGVRMRLDESTNRIVAQIMDQNHQVIRQIPPEELLKIAARIRQLEGVLFDQNA